MQEVVRQRRGCNVPGCQRPHSGRGFCIPHYHRFRKHGTPTGGGDPRSRRKKWRACSVEGCDARHRARGLCVKHFKMQTNYGRTTSVKRRRGSGFINQDGYHATRVGGRHKFTHRSVMEEKLGRPLLADEVVHHVNGDRLDNRPENLELWSKSQPPGQRIADKVAWAHELIARYEPEWVGGGC